MFILRSFIFIFWKICIVIVLSARWEGKTPISTGIIVYAHRGFRGVDAGGLSGLSKIVSSIHWGAISCTFWDHLYNYKWSCWMSLQNFMASYYPLRVIEIDGHTPLHQIPRVKEFFNGSFHGFLTRSFCGNRKTKSLVSFLLFSPDKKQNS